MFATHHKDLLVKQYLKPKLLCKFPNTLTISRSGQMGRPLPYLDPTIHNCPGILCAPAASHLSAVCRVCHAPFGPFSCAASCSWKLSIPSLLSYFNPAHASHLGSEVTFFKKPSLILWVVAPGPFLSLGLHSPWRDSLISMSIPLGKAPQEQKPGLYLLAAVAWVPSTEQEHSEHSSYSWRKEHLNNEQEKFKWGVL